jgi:hypothetical protein
MDQDIFLNALSAADVKAAYESNADTNAFTDALLGKLNGVEAEAKDDQIASEVPYTNTSSNLTAVNVQSAIDEVEGRVDTLETDLSTHTSDSTIHFTQSQISITESQISDLGNYEVADATILKSADIGVTVQGFNANTVVDANYETFDSDGTFANLRAQATTKDDVGLGNVTNESKATMFTDPTFTGTVSGVTSSHVGLGSVENYGIATKEEAEAGSATNKYMTPERTKEAILELSPPTDLTGIEGRLDTIEGDDQTTGSIAKALFDAKDYTDTEIDAAKLALGTNFSVADITERNALQDLTIGDIVFVADDGDNK